MKADSFLIRAYKVQPPHHVSVINLLDVGDRNKKKYKEIATPQNVFRVRVDTSSSDSVEYYLYDKKTDYCVGFFMLDIHEDEHRDPVKPGVHVVTPHLSLSDAYKGKGYASMIYQSFLAGDRVFVTTSHTKDAKILWDALAKKPGMVSFFIDPATERRVSTPNAKSVRYLGREALFAQSHYNDVN